jgi:formyl-CoA transferase
MQSSDGAPCRSVLPEQPDEVAMTDQISPRPDGGTPLQDLRVTELGQLLAGPFCGQLLGDFGAEVIKVEDPGQGDPMRQWGREKPHGMSLWWPVVARNKKSVTANLRDPRGQDLVRRLAERSDVLLENFRPGTLERWGLAPEQLWEINPGLVITRVTGFGQTGPYAPRAGFGSIGEAMGGIRYVTGDADRPPSRAGISLGDALAATFAALGTMVALHARQRTGRGHRCSPNGPWPGTSGSGRAACCRTSLRATSIRPATAIWSSSPPTRTRCSGGWPG